MIQQIGHMIINTAAAIDQDNPVLGSAPAGASTITDLFGGVTGLLALIAGVLAFIYLVYSGILYLTAAGNPDAAKKGQQGIINSIIGIIIIVAAWTIINAVQGTTDDTVDGDEEVTVISQMIA